jgi:ribonuclease D
MSQANPPKPAAMPKPIFINQPAALDALAKTLLGETCIAVDTESNSLYAYREQVCLIQFSTRQRDYLVDPLALDDLSALGDAFCSEEIEKVFHAAEYDLICLRRDFGFEFRHIFDTMTAGRMLGRDEVGLGAMLLKEFDVQVDKRHQRANWGQRPLPDYLLNYAQYDTHFLIPLRERLSRELDHIGRLELALEDFNRLCHADSPNHENKSADCWRISGALDLPPRNLAVLGELCRYRDQMAKAMNRPLFKVIEDRTLVAIAAWCPTSLEQMQHIPGMSHSQIERHGRALLTAVQRGMKADPMYPPRHPRPDEGLLVRLEALRNWRKNKAGEMGVGSDVVMPRDLVFSLAEKNPHNREELAGVLRDSPWRNERFGGEILEVLKGCDH